MRVSELVKKLFAIMGKQGDLVVVGSFHVEGKEIHLSGPDNTETLTPDDSEILSMLLRESHKDGRTTP